jgi:fucose 4-O-acetylase-like acetyltransferase
MQQLGRTSLFIYWIHVEMVYGLVSMPLHHALSLRQAAVALVLFTFFMLACSLAKDRVVAWWTGGRGRLRLERE